MKNELKFKMNILKMNIPCFFPDNQSDNFHINTDKF